MHAGQELRKIRMANGLTQQKIADALSTHSRKVDRARISGIEKSQNLETYTIGRYLNSMGFDFVGFKTRLIKN